MSYTIFTSNPTLLIPQPGRTVDTFPSGLVRVSQIYIGRTANAAAHRATLAVGNNMPDGDSSPCIDGLKIFPEVQERRREDGMTEFIVTAYGRANTTGKTNTININLPTPLTWTTRLHAADTRGGWGVQAFNFTAKINIAKQIFIHKTSPSNSFINLEEINYSLLNPQLSSIKLISSTPTASNYSNPIWFAIDEDRWGFAYLLGFSNYELTSTIQASPEIVVSLFVTAVVNNPVRLIVNQQYVVYPAGSRVQIAQLDLPIPNPTPSISINNYGSYNEVGQQFIIE